MEESKANESHEDTLSYLDSSMSRVSLQTLSVAPDEELELLASACTSLLVLQVDFRKKDSLFFLLDLRNLTFCVMLVYVLNFLLIVLFLRVVDSQYFHEEVGWV